MFTSNVHNGKIFRAQGSALAVLGVTLVLSSLLYFRAQGLEEPAEYEPRPEVQSSSWLGHAPRLEKAWARSATDWFPSLYVHSLIGSSVHHISTGVYLFASCVIRAPTVLPLLYSSRLIMQWV